MLYLVSNMAFSPELIKANLKLKAGRGIKGYPGLQVAVRIEDPNTLRPGLLRLCLIEAKKRARSPTPNFPATKFHSSIGGEVQKYRKKTIQAAKAKVVKQEKEPSPEPVPEPVKVKQVKQPKPESPMVFTIKNDLKETASPQRTVVELPDRGLIIKKELKPVVPSPVPAPAPARTTPPPKQTSARPPLPLPPMIDAVDSPVIAQKGKGDVAERMRNLSRDRARSRTSITDLPLPPMAPTPDESPVDTPSPQTQLRLRAKEKDSKDPKVDLGKREMIRQRRAKMAGSSLDWGERCVDVFEIINQIGEGTYGQVYKARDKDTGETSGTCFTKPFFNDKLQKSLTNLLIYM